MSWPEHVARLLLPCSFALCPAHGWHQLSQSHSQLEKL